MTQKKNPTAEDIERLRAYRREWTKRKYYKNVEAARAKARTAYWNEPEKYRAITAEVRKKNPGLVRARTNDWAKRNKEHLASYKEKTKERRAALAKARGRKQQTEAQKEAARKRASTWFSENRERARIAKQGYYAKNAERLKAYARKWCKENPGVGAKHKAAKRRAIPKWADVDAIQDVYKEAAYMQMEVDHIVPLQSPFVCGLHVEHNLQLLTKSENSRKGNRYWPDMPS